MKILLLQKSGNGIENLINTLTPLAYGAIIFICIFGIGRSVIFGKYKEIPIQLLIYCVAAYMVYAPQTFRVFGEKIINLITTFIDLVGSGLI